MGLRGAGVFPFGGIGPLCRTAGGGLAPFAEVSFLCSADPYFAWDALPIAQLDAWARQIQQVGRCALGRSRRPLSRPDRRYPAEVTTADGHPLEARSRRAMAGLLLAAALLIAGYWLAWLLHRSVVASESGAAYNPLEEAFPLAA